MVEWCLVNRPRRVVPPTDGSLFTIHHLPPVTSDSAVSVWLQLAFRPRGWARPQVPLEPTWRDDLRSVWPRLSSEAAESVAHRGRRFRTTECGDGRSRRRGRAAVSRLLVLCRSRTAGVDRTPHGGRERPWERGLCGGSQRTTRPAHRLLGRGRTHWQPGSFAHCPHSPQLDKRTDLCDVRVIVGSLAKLAVVGEHHCRDKCHGGLRLERCRIQGDVGERDLLEHVSLTDFLAQRLFVQPRLSPSVVSSRRAAARCPTVVRRRWRRTAGALQRVTRPSVAHRSPARTRGREGRTEW